VKNYDNFSRVFEITSSLRSLVRYPVGHSKRNSISPRTHVLSLFPQLLQSWQLFQVVLPKSGFSSTKCRPTRSAAETLVFTEKEKPHDGQNKELTEVFLEMLVRSHHDFNTKLPQQSDIKKADWSAEKNTHDLPFSSRQRLSDIDHRLSLEE